MRRDSYTQAKLSLREQQPGSYARSRDGTRAARFDSSTPTVPASGLPPFTTAASTSSTSCASPSVNSGSSGAGGSAAVGRSAERSMTETTTKIRVGDGWEFDYAFSDVRYRSMNLSTVAGSRRIAAINWFLRKRSRPASRSFS